MVLLWLLESRRAGLVCKLQRVGVVLVCVTSVLVLVLSHVSQRDIIDRCRVMFLLCGSRGEEHC